MRGRPGFVSATGIVIAVALLAGVLAWTGLAGPVLFSPGPLNSAATGPALGGVTDHAELTRDCGACHPAPWSAQTMADRCLACHEGVGAQIKTRKGIHGGLAEMGSALTCSGCHPDHRGADAALTVLDPASFPHDLTGYSLRTHKRTAQGRRFTCADCHGNDLMRFDQKVCADCHRSMDAAFMTRHEADYGTECLPCHDGSGTAAVDHSRFPFKLTGKHAGVACDKCHAGAGSLQDYQKTPQDCFSCHAKDDEHEGAYGRQCEDCHTAADWGEATFDHAVFPLDHGADEEKATCQTCHPTDVKSYTCYGCHAHTEGNVRGEHEGQSLAELADCIRCHPGGRQAEDD
jgi:hypothetical protein